MYSQLTSYWGFEGLRNYSGGKGGVIGRKPGFVLIFALQTSGFLSPTSKHPRFLPRAETQRGKEYEDPETELRSYKTTAGRRLLRWRRNVRRRAHSNHNSRKCPLPWTAVLGWNVILGSPRLGITGGTLTSYPEAEGNGARWSVSPYPFSQNSSEKTIQGYVP